MSDRVRWGEVVRKDFNLSWNAPFSSFFFFLFTREYSHILIAEVKINHFFEEWPYNIIFTEIYGWDH